MIIAAFCPACAEPRARSRDLPPTQRPVAADFEPIGDQTPPVDGEPANCSKCGTALVFRRMPPEGTNGHANQRLARRQDEHSTPADHTAVEVLFAASDGEEVRQMRDLGRDRILIVTSRRILIVNLNAIAEELP